MGKYYKHLTWNDRLTIDKLKRKGYSNREIANVIECCLATVYNELKRSTYRHTNSDLTVEKRYNPEGAEKRYRDFLKQKGNGRKVQKAPKLAQYISSMIIENKYSPNAVLLEMRNEGLSFEQEIRSVNTIYRSIKCGDFPGLTMAHVPQGEKKKRKKKVSTANRATPGKSIEKRPQEVEDREEFGHWEMDTVKGQITNKKNLLVMTERKSRLEIVEPLKDNTTAEVVKALNRVEKRYGSFFFKIFKTVTVDNGTEFADTNGIEKALYRVGKRFDIYYCHPYSSFERGSNENQNRLIRRFFPKGSNFDNTLNKADIKYAEDWINKYPRALLGGVSATRIFELECAKIRAG